MSGLPYEVSNSEIQTFLRCRRKWWLSYVEGWRPRPSPAMFLGPLAIGSRVHKALELHYKEEADLMATHAALLDKDRRLLIDDGFATEKLDSEGELARIMLEGYLEWVSGEGLDADLLIIGVEEILKYPVLPGKVTLIGKIDLRIHRLRDDTRAVLDFKTSANFEDFTATAHMAPQLLTYMTLDHTSGDEATRVDGGMYRLLKKVKRGPRATPPFYRELTIRHNVFTLRSFWRRLTGMLTEMFNTRQALEAGEPHQFWAYPTPNRTCSWDCQFLRICPMFDDGSGVDDALNDEYVRADPYDYYRSGGGEEAPSE
jgi:RecB family exonuclease